MHSIEYTDLFETRGWGMMTVSQPISLRQLGEQLATWGFDPTLVEIELIHEEFGVIIIHDRELALWLRMVFFDGQA